MPLLFLPDAWSKDLMCATAAANLVHGDEVRTQAMLERRGKRIDPISDMFYFFFLLFYFQVCLNSISATCNAKRFEKYLCMRISCMTLLKERFFSTLFL